VTFPQTENWDNYVAAAQAGSIAFDEQAAGSCASLVRNRGCALSTNPTRAEVDEACGGVWTGTLADGAACRLDAECASEQCVAPVCDPFVECCAGTCTPRDIPAQSSQAGGPCWTNWECALGMFCAPAIRTAGTMGTCRVLVAEGEPCDSPFDCQEDLVCRGWGTVGDVGACGRAPATGAACEPSEFDACDDLRDHCSLVTLACERRIPVGESCDSFTTYGECVAYGYCTAGGGCAPLPAQAGQACAESFDCLGQLACVGSVCEQPPAYAACF
jgi:hypothetical protein